MSQYTPTSGTILQIEPQSNTGTQDGCSLRLTLQTLDQGLVQVTVTGSTYVLDNQLLRTGDQITCFYSLLAPVPLIYPPLYRALAIVPTTAGTYASLDVFTQTSYNNQFTNSDTTLLLNLFKQTSVTLPNGQSFLGSLSGHLLLVTYGATTRSIPAQTTPDRVIVFCNT